MLACYTEEFSAAAVVFLEKVFQMKFLVNLEEEIGFGQVMVLALKGRSKGDTSQGLSPPGCCRSLHHMGVWKAVSSFPLKTHTDFKDFCPMLVWRRGASTVFEEHPAQYLPSVDSWPAGTCLVWWGTSKVLRKLSSGGWIGSQCAMLGRHLMHWSCLLWNAG